MVLRRLLFLFMASALGAQICSAQERFPIGMVICLSGECAEHGQNTIRGAELAAKELNARGGILGRQIEFKVQDSREAVNGADAVSAFRNLSTDKSIQYYIGPSWSAAGLSLAPIVARIDSVIMTSPTLGVADFNEAGENIFNLWPHDEVGTRALARYALQRGWKKTAIFSSQQPWCSAQGDFFADEFKKNGGTVAVKEEPLPDAPSVSAESYRIVRSQPDVVFFSNYLKMGSGAAKLRELNYTGPIITILMDRTQLEVAKGALEGAIFSQYPEAAKGFSERYEAQYHAKPGIGADTAYDVVMLYARALEQAKTFDPKVVRGVMLHEEFDGASGHISFDEKGGVKKTPQLFQIKGSNFEPIQAAQ